MTIQSLTNDKKFKIFAISVFMAIAAPIFNGPLQQFGIDITPEEVQHFLFLALGLGTTGIAAGAVQKQHARKAADIARQAGANPETVADIAEPERKARVAQAAKQEAKITKSQPTVKATVHSEPVHNAQTSATSQTPGPSLEAERAAHGWSGPAKDYKAGPGNPPSAQKSRKSYMPDFPLLADGTGAFRTNLSQVQTPEGKTDPGFPFGTPALFVQSRFHVKTNMQGELTDSTGNRIRVKQSWVDYEDAGKLCFKLIKTGVVPEEPLPRGKYNLYVEEDVDSSDPTRNKEDIPFWIV